jgi:hypothetical protein
MRVSAGRIADDPYEVAVNLPGGSPSGLIR